MSRDPAFQARLGQEEETRTQEIQLVGSPKGRLGPLRRLSHGLKAETFEKTKGGKGP